MLMQGSVKGMPLCMVNHDVMHASATELKEGTDFSYNDQEQKSSWVYAMGATPSGYYTNQGGDWVKTDERFITPDGPK